MKLGVQLSIKKCGQSTVDSFHGESCHMCISSNWVLHSLNVTCGKFYAAGVYLSM